jgi:hypothetical protein
MQRRIASLFTCELGCCSVLLELLRFAIKRVALLYATNDFTGTKRTRCEAGRQGTAAEVARVGSVNNSRVKSDARRR